MSRYGTYDLKHGFIPDDDCPQQETPKQTNADRIRAMSDEELTEFLYVVTGGSESSGSCVPGCYDCRKYDDCKEAWLDWLQQEVEGDVG